MRPKGSAELLEYRRHQALALVDEGYSLNEAAGIIGCSPSSVMRWRDKRDKGGEEALKVRFSPGRPTRLSKSDIGKLKKILLKGPMASGYRTDLWTTARIAEVIEKKFGVKYHRDHIGRIMKQIGWTHHKPERRATERNQERIDHWVEKEWPRVKITPAGWAPILPS